MNTRRQYFLNLIWSWAGAVAMILNGVIVSPYLIRRLGSELYGIWAVGLALVEYFWMIDLGLRPATVKLTAEYRALEKWDALNRLLSTAGAYSLVMGVLISALVSLNTGWIARFYHIQHPSFGILVTAVSLSWGFGLFFNIFSAAVEGFQRFDISSRIYLVSLVLRNVLLLSIVALGHGLGMMSIALLATQLLMYSAFYVSLRRLYPQMKLSVGMVNKESGREIWMYARQMISAMLSGRLISSVVPSLIAHFLGVRNVTYYSVTQRSVDYAGEGIGRIGLITGPRASDWMARGMIPQIVRMARYGNKYALTLWGVFASFLLIYGPRVFRVWVNAEFADHAGALLVIIVAGYTLWYGQFISAAILMGIGRYGEYSTFLMLEAILAVLGFAITLPFYGLVWGVAVASILLALNRSFNLARIFCKHFQLNYVDFVASIYTVPLSLIAADMLLLWGIKSFGVPGNAWRQLIPLGVLNAALYSAIAFFVVLEPEHREMMLEQVKDRTAILWRRFSRNRLQGTAAGSIAKP